MMSIIRVFITNISFISDVFLMNYHLFLHEIYLFISSHFFCLQFEMANKIQIKFKLKCIYF